MANSFKSLSVGHGELTGYKKHWMVMKRGLEWITKWLFVIETLCKTWIYPFLFAQNLLLSETFLAQKGLNY